MGEWWPENQDTLPHGVQPIPSRRSSRIGRSLAWLRLGHTGGRPALAIAGGVAAIVLIVACIAGLLSTRTGLLQFNRGIDLSTPTPQVTVTPVASGTVDASGTPSVTGGSGTASATILVQARKVPFITGVKTDPAQVAIDDGVPLIIATDGSGQLQAFMRTFDWVPSTGFTPVIAGSCCTGEGAPAHFNGSQIDYYFVPSDCATGYTDLLYAQTDAYQRVKTLIDAYEHSTQNDAHEMFSRFPVNYPVTYEKDKAVCSPGVGYQQSTPFFFSTSYPAHVTVPMFKVSEVYATRKQQLLSHTPANYAVSDYPKVCPDAIVTSVSATRIAAGCGLTGFYHWKWTSQIARSLAAQIAGKDTATARNILAAYPGADIFHSQGISFQLVGGTTLPSDPSKITFKVYDSVLVGVNDVQTTGTPQIVP